MLKLRKFLTFLLYSLPVAFFVVCYFLIVTSGEDIFQGANSAPNIIKDSFHAFYHSARLADMFAWSVINFFDYTFSFGFDTVFRLLDVFVAFLTFYMATFCVLGRRPAFRLKDALVFNLLFLSVMLTSNGPTIYSGFSKIHNYLFISFFSFLFFIPLLRRLQGRPFLIKNLYLRNLGFFLVSFLFGFSSNVSGIVVLVALPVYILYEKLQKKPVPLKPFLKNYGASMLLGILLSLFIIYILGPGLADYSSSPAYLIVCDYLPLEELFSSPLPSLVRIIKHNIYNFGKFFFPFAVVSVPIFIVLRREIKSFKSHFSSHELNFLSASLIFVVLHILALSQIFYPTRLLFPLHLFFSSVYFFVVFRLFCGYFSGTKNPHSLERKPTASNLSSFSRHSLSNPRNLKIFAISTCLVLSVAVLSVRTAFAVEYLRQVKPTFDEIKNLSSASASVSSNSSIPPDFSALSTSSNSSTSLDLSNPSTPSDFCVPSSIYRSRNLPYFHLGQEDFLVDWALPETIYGVPVTFCN
ncbi:hypothetical protein IKG02_02305 [Candidatus Saccharibacteria bacterium]|nr:hypothetical protein [Candidatus Saccharibacteria bacterium]